ncbi:hypothetical protein MF672_043530 [Actinomadura sp. ATCC 31491]|uniref:Uncharacterized protein n=1 Tax=Actinomadura luzonensis TaxID=2805427 RepID=A0ABT0G7Q1_9ACTN|nr:hypothetical protein [Actinomadura luzonensis]MCK2220629.1 hypothetical protein [Actinomadura luzonensis]
MPGAADPDATRLWSVWQSDGTAWLATSAEARPADGAVVGWRLSAVPGGSFGSSGEPPGGDLPTFGTVCGKDVAASGHKRVALAVDFGDGAGDGADEGPGDGAGDGAGDAYPGDRPPSRVLACVSGAEDATAAQLLAGAAQVRVDGRGGVVSVNGHPSRAAGAAALPPAPAVDGGSSGGTPVGVIAGGAGAVVLLAGAAVLAARRRARPRTPDGGRSAARP